MTFAAGLRAILRQDPDVVMVGEIRDKETAEIAIQASLTGHLVLSTIHTNDTLGAITRLIDMGVEPYLLASSLRTIISQRLVRKLSSDGETYSGRQGIFEILDIDQNVKELINDDFSEKKVRDIIDPQHDFLEESGQKLIQDGVTTLEEVRRVLMEAWCLHLITLSSDGKKIKGSLIADDINLASQELKSRSLIPIDLKERKASGSFLSFLSHKIKSSDLALITRQMSTLINAGIPVDRALDSVAEQLSDKSSANKLKEISMRVKEGYKFSEALKEFPESFDSLYVSLIEAGESSGELGNVMEETADYLEKRATLNQEILGATIYPMVLFATSLVIISLLLIFVVPNVVSQFANSNQQLPFLTMAMLGISNFFTSLWFGLLIVFLALIAFIGIRFIGISKFFLYVDKVLLKLPIINKFIIDSNLSRFTNSLSILRSSNVPIIRSLDISANTVSNRILKKDINFASVEVSEGNSLARSLSKSKYIPSLIIEMISSGEASGELENMLIKVSKYLQDRFNHSTKITLNLLEPAVIIFMGGFVSLIVLAILLPLIQLNTFSL